MTEKYFLNEQICHGWLQVLSRSSIDLYPPSKKHSLAKHKFNAFEPSAVLSNNKIAVAAGISDESSFLVAKNLLSNFVNFHIRERKNYKCLQKIKFLA
jgi:hypothetical protein